MENSQPSILCTLFYYKNLEPNRNIYVHTPILCKQKYKFIINNNGMRNCSFDLISNLGKATIRAENYYPWN